MSSGSPPPPPGAGRAGALRALLGPALDAAGVELDDLAVTTAGRRRLVRVVVDRDGGLDLDGVAAASTAVSAVLDGPDGDAALGSAPYVLEVSTPGVDRPLTEPRHWRRARGRLVTVTVAPPADTSDAAPDAAATPAGRVTGRVTAVDERGVRLDVDGAERHLGFDRLGPGHVQVEFRRSEPAGGAGEESEGGAGGEEEP